MMSSQRYLMPSSDGLRKPTDPQKENGQIINPPRYAELGGLDALVFTAGVGENSAVVRQGAVEGLGFLGIEVDGASNLLPGSESRRISPASARVPVLVIPTDEELQIARETATVIGGQDLRH